MNVDGEREKEALSLQHIHTDTQTHRHTNTHRHTHTHSLTLQGIFHVLGEQRPHDLSADFADVELLREPDRGGEGSVQASIRDKQSFIYSTAVCVLVCVWKLKYAR